MKKSQMKKSNLKLLKSIRPAMTFRIIFLALVSLSSHFSFFRRETTNGIGSNIIPAYIPRPNTPKKSDIFSFSLEISGFFIHKNSKTYVICTANFTLMHIDPSLT